MKIRAAKSAIGRHHEVVAKFLVLWLLVLVQMGVVPFLTILVHNTAKQERLFQLADGRSNLSIVYKRNGLN